MDARGLPDWVKETFGWVLQTVLRPVGVKGFVICPSVGLSSEPSPGWAVIDGHSKDYEKTTASAEAFTYIAMINLMSKRPAAL